MWRLLLLKQLGSLNRGQKLAWLAAEGLSDEVDLFERDAHDPALDTAHITAVDPGDVCKILLRNSSALSLLSDVLSKQFGQFVHSVHPDGQGEHCHYLED